MEGATAANNTISKCNETLEIAFWILYGSASVVILAGNVFTLLVFLRTKRFCESYMDVFLVSLAAADIIMAVFVAPGFAVFCTGCVYPATKHCWLLAAPKDIAFGGTVFNLLAISYDRFIAVIRPLRYYSEMTKRRVTFMLIAVWGVSSTTAVLRNAWQHTRSEEEVKRIDKIYNSVLASVLVLLPILAIFVMNVKIIQVIRRQNRRVHLERQRGTTAVKPEPEVHWQRTNAKKGTLACVLVVFVFLICWFPREFCNLSYVFGRPDLVSDVLVKISWLLIFVQSAANPFIYSFYRSEFRQAALAMIRCRTRSGLTQS